VRVMRQRRLAAACSAAMLVLLASPWAAAAPEEAKAPAGIVPIGTGPPASAPGSSPLPAKAPTATAAVAAPSPTSTSPAPGSPGPTAPAARLVASKEPGWPQWRGPRRDGVSDEKGLLQSWPDGGPKLLWKIERLGRGWSSPIISGGYIYITGDVGDNLVVYAFDMDGKPKWQAKNGAAWKGQYPGSRACCALAGGRVYDMSAHGRAACYDAASGKEIWAVDVLQRFGGRNITWAMAECLLVDGPRIIVCPGTAKSMAALDAATGATVWIAPPVAGDKAGYSSPILFEFGGRRHIVNHSSQHLFDVDADTGELLWSVPRPIRTDVNASTPVLVGDGVFAGSPDGIGGALYRLRVEGRQVRAEQAWTTTMDCLTGGAVCVGGAIFGSGHYNVKGVAALDALTGRTRYELKDRAIGSAAWADGRLYSLSQEGEMTLLEPAAAAFRPAGGFRVPGTSGKTDVWAHPVICGARMYLRYHDTLWCYDVRG